MNNKQRIRKSRTVTVDDEIWNLAKVSAENLGLNISAYIRQLIVKDHPGYKKGK